MPGGGLARTLVARRPSLVVAGRLGPAALRQSRSARPVRAGRAGKVGPMRLFPRMRLVLFLRRRHIHHMMQPAMPARRHHGGLGDAAVNHPAALKTEGRIDFPSWCDSSDCRTRPRRRIRRTASSTHWVPKVWPFHQVKVRSRKVFIAESPARFWPSLYLTSALMPFRDGSVQGWDRTKVGLFIERFEL